MKTATPKIPEPPEVVNARKLIAAFERKRAAELKKSQRPPTLEEQLEEESKRLLPCPFCGGEAGLKYGSKKNHVHAQCNECIVSVMDFYREWKGAFNKEFCDEIVKKWNRREPPLMETKATTSTP